jgi:polyhydroxybutyrate depolymerase
MRRRRLLAWSATGIGAALAGCSTGRPSAPGDPERRRLSHDGRERTSLLYRPPDLDPGTHPLVVVLHGGGGDGERVARTTGFSSLAAEAGFLVAYPDGTPNWNDGRDGAGPPGAAGVDDVGFLRALVGRLGDDPDVDPERVGVTGISNGGMMTLRVVCEAPDVPAAAATVAASLPVGRDCDPSEPVPLLALHGTADPLVPYGGGAVGFVRGSGGRGRVRSAEATVGRFVGAYGCGPDPETRRLPNRVRDATHVTERRYDGCSGGAVVRHLVVHGGGHGWPGTDHGALDLALGNTTQDVDATRAIWEFFAEQFRGR